METAESAFSVACHLSSLTPHQPTGVTLPDGERVCLVLSGDDRVIAFADECPHRGHPLSEGDCENGILRCALHGWEFSTEDGRAVSPASPFGLKLREVRVGSDGSVEVASR